MTVVKGSNKAYLNKERCKRKVRRLSIKQKRGICRRTIKEAIKKERTRKKEVMAGSIWGLLVFGQQEETCQVMASRHTHTHTHTHTTYIHTHTLAH